MQITNAEIAALLERYAVLLIAQGLAAKRLVRQSEGTDLGQARRTWLEAAEVSSTRGWRSPKALRPG